jgi:hypothetical protein
MTILRQSLLKAKNGDFVIPAAEPTSDRALGTPGKFFAILSKLTSTPWKV